jgi:hypothetical protein
LTVLRGLKDRNAVFYHNVDGPLDGKRGRKGLKLWGKEDAHGVYAGSLIPE